MLPYANTGQWVVWHARATRTKLLVTDIFHSLATHLKLFKGIHFLTKQTYSVHSKLAYYWLYTHYTEGKCYANYYIMLKCIAFLRSCRPSLTSCIHKLVYASVRYWRDYKPSMYTFVHKIAVYVTRTKYGTSLDL